ncbi:hypothetical protein Taro_027704 [Colocasia esculenta]|uniref:Uncharacterized protein n=1 Tax=Colocasia esculenta TaxID=4460 RepID=A0A843VN96_COLES|nr:hypothetical protein [Colocasia esculenta]
MQNFCKSSVDTRSSGVDIMPQAQDKIVQNWSTSVDTKSVLGSSRSYGHDYHSAGISLALSSIVQTGSVDTRDSSQNTF